MAFSLPTSVKYDDTTLRRELLRLGFDPGPIQDSTRNLYLNKLYALKKDEERSSFKRYVHPSPTSYLTEPNDYYKEYDDETFCEEGGGFLKKKHAPVVQKHEKGRRKDVSFEERSIFKRYVNPTPTSYFTDHRYEEYDDETFCEELQKLSFNPRPILNSTRSLCEKKLCDLKKDQIHEKGRRQDVSFEERSFFKRYAHPTPASYFTVDRSTVNDRYEEYDDETFCEELQKLSFNPRPILNSTRSLCEKKLYDLKKDQIHEKAYSPELERSFCSDKWMSDLTAFEELEMKVRADFSDQHKKWRDGNSMTYFTYLLLDPRITDNLPAKRARLSELQAWVTFVNSIFYVGKGTRARPYEHLIKAKRELRNEGTCTTDDKNQHILDIWQSNLGVVCLIVFQHVISVQAHTNEAAMIDVIGVSALRNIQSGTYYGVAKTWPLRDKRMLGLYLLYKAMKSFMLEGERQMRPENIKD